MLRLLFRLSLIIFVVNQLMTPCSAFRRYSNQRGSKYDKGYKDPVKPNTVEGNSVGVPSQGQTRKGLGISAWGIIILIVAIILGVMGLYYFSICYPIICRKNTKYNLMGAPTLA